jgi:hypothetical protein
MSEEAKLWLGKLADGSECHVEGRGQRGVFGWKCLKVGASQGRKEEGGEKDTKSRARKKTLYSSSVIPTYDSELVCVRRRERERYGGIRRIDG